MQLFFGNPNRSFYVREITRKVDEQINSVRRELSNLLSIGIIKSETNNNRVYYEVDQKFEFYKPLGQMFGGVVSKSKSDSSETVAGVEKEVDDASTAVVRKLGNVEVAIMTGRFTRESRIQADFVLVGDISQSKLAKFITDLEKSEGIEVRYVILTSEDFAYRLQIKDRFVHSLFEVKKQVLVDKNSIYTK